MLIGYARVSMQVQDTELQTRALQEAGCERIFVEKASGAQRDRPQLQEAIRYLRKGDVLVVWKLDRLARSLRQLLETVDDLKLRGIGFKSLTESIDTTSPTGTLIFQIFGALAEFERGLIRERTKAGLDIAKANGKVLGRPKTITENKLKVAETLLRDGRLNVNEVAMEIGVSPATLYRHFPGGRSGLSRGW